MVTLNDILKLIASHRHENQTHLSHILSRIQEQEGELTELLTEYVVTQDPTISTKDLLDKIKIRDLEYWYTPLSEISGYSELAIRTINSLKYKDIYYLGDLVTKTAVELLRIPNFGRKSFNDLSIWLTGLGEELGQELKEYRENHALLRYFDERISYREDDGAEYRKLDLQTYHKVTGLKIYTIGEVATSVSITDMSDYDLQDIERCLKQWDENLRPGMHLPYRPT